MDSMAINMLQLALALFLIAALGGLVMAVRVFQGKGLKIPPALAAFHGTLGLVAMMLLLAVILAYGHDGTHLIKVALGILLVAACGGLYLVSFHMRKKPHPKAFVPVHALFAVSGVGVLLWAILQLTK